MKATRILAVLVLGALLGLPALALAEENKADEAKFQAAVRLFAAYVAAVEGGQSCAARGQDGGREAATNYNERNGSTLAKVNQIIKAHGGFTPKTKNSIEAYKKGYLDAILGSTADCPDFIKALDAGQWDLYKSPRWAKDYKLVVGHP